VGKVYVQVVIDTFCSLGFAKVYNTKMPVTACDLLYERVLPIYDALGVPVKAILTDNGRKFFGRPESHPHEQLVAMEDVEHRTIKVRSPRTNGFVERMDRMLLDECFRVAGRQTWYVGIDEIQCDLDVFKKRLQPRTATKAIGSGGARRPRRCVLRSVSASCRLSHSAIARTPRRRTCPPPKSPTKLVAQRPPRAGILPCSGNESTSGCDLYRSRNRSTENSESRSTMRQVAIGRFSTVLIELSASSNLATNQEQVGTVVED